MKDGMKMYICPIGTFSYFIKSGDTLVDLARRYNTNVDAIRFFNPGVNPENMMIGSTLCIPLSDYNYDITYPMNTYCYYVKIKPGDTVYELAQLYNTTTDAIMMANPGIAPEALVVGQMLCIPRIVSETRENPTTRPQCINVTIRQGDYPYLLAQRYKTTIEAILEANPRIDPNDLKIGQTICIPVNDENFSMLSANLDQTLTYDCIFRTIRKGDTFRDLAVQFNTTIDELLKANPDVDPTNLKIGQIICIPRPSKAAGPMRRDDNNNITMPNNVRYMDIVEDLRTNPTIAVNCINYTIKKGDTIRDLASEYKTTNEAILFANPGIDPYNLQIGQVICIPNTKGGVNCIYYKIEKGDTFKDLAKEFDTTVEALLLANPGVDPTDLKIGQVVCIPRVTASNCIYRTIRQGDTFRDLAKTYNITVDAIIRANPNVDPTDLKIGQIICIPQLEEERIQKEKCINKIVEPGDTIYSYAKEYNTTVDAILAANIGVDPTKLKIGQVICIPAKDGFKCMYHKVKLGDNLIKIAKHHNTTVGAILLANRDIKPNDLQIGQMICIPTPTNENICFYHRMRKGETIADLAKKHMITIEDIMDVNPGVDPRAIKVGQEICLPLNKILHIDMMKSPSEMDMDMDMDMNIDEEVRKDKCIDKVVEAGDTIYSYAKSYNTTVDAILIANPGIDPTRLQIGQVICIPTVKDYIKKSAVNTEKRIRILWDQHIIWVNMTMVDLIFNLPKLPFSEKRLLRNANDFAEVLTPYYGESNANRLASLFIEHVTIGLEYIRALNSKNTRRAETLERNWYANADEIARFLNSINPNWKFEQWQKMLYEHLRIASDLAKSYIDRNFEQSITLSDQAQMQALEMADKMSKGLMKQFPKQF